MDSAERPRLLLELLANSNTRGDKVVMENFQAWKLARGLLWRKHYRMCICWGYSCFKMDSNIKNNPIPVLIYVQVFDGVMLTYVRQSVYLLRLTPFFAYLALRMLFPYKELGRHTTTGGLKYIWEPMGTLGRFIFWEHAYAVV